MTTAVTTGVEIRAENWSYQHADRRSAAVSGLHLHISPGEKVLLAGASGAGKSTLLHALAGVLHSDDAASEGALLLDGTSPELARGRAGLVQQDPESQVVLARIGDDVAFACENLAVDPSEMPGRVAEALGAVGLDQLPLQHSTAALSGGQKQRLALAGILAMRPGLLLLDEPTAHLDPEGAEQVRGAVISAAERTGATLVVVEHRLHGWIEQMDTLVVLDPGGGVRHRVPAAHLQENPQLRTDLQEAGLWVPDADPLACLSTWEPQHRVPEETLLSAHDMAVHRGAHRSRRGEVPAVLENVELSLPVGTATGIVGRNGAGKSTLLLTLGGLLPALGGDLRAHPRLKGDAGTALEDSPHQWRSADLISRIGTVFQEPEHQFITSTVAAELRLSAERARAPGSSTPLFSQVEVNGRTQWLLQRLNLAHLEHSNPFTLSGGEKRRLSVGTALAAGPEVLMLDEPTFGQDARTFTDLVGLLRDHLDTGGTMVAVTHDRAFLRAVGAQTVDATQFTGAVSAARSLQTSSGSHGGMQGFQGPRDDSWLGRRSPLGKLVALVLITLALISTIDPVSAAVVAAVSTLLLPAAGIGMRTFLRRIWPFALGAVVAVWGTAIAAEESGRVLLDLGFTTVSTGSVELGLSLGARALAIVMPSLLILSTTDPTDMADTLAQQLRLPARFVLGALAAMRLLGLLAEHWTTLGQARRARGLGTRFLSQVFGLLVQAIRMATRLAVTMESRGFGAGKRTWARRTRLDSGDVGVMLAGAALAATATGAAIAAGTWNLVWS